MAKQTRNKACTSKQKSEEMDNMDKQISVPSRKLKFSDEAEETEDAIMPSGTNFIPASRMTRSGRKVKASKRFADESISTNNNATKVVTTSSKLGETSQNESTSKINKSNAIRSRQSLKSPKVKKAQTGSHDHDKTGTAHLDRDKLLDSQIFEDLDHIPNQDHFDDSDGSNPNIPHQFDGIDVTIDASDEDEFLDNEQDVHQSVVLSQTSSQSPTEILNRESVTSGQMIVTNVAGNLDAVKLQQENASLKLLIDELVNQKVQMKLAEAGVKTTQEGCSNIDQANKGNQKPTKQNSTRGGDLVKSPSDKTIYAPGLTQGKRVVNALDQITNFVEEIKLSSVLGQNFVNDNITQVTNPSLGGELSGSKYVIHQPSSRHSLEEELNRVEEEDQRHMAKDRADKIVLEAEKYRAEVAAPSGKVFQNEITDEIRLKRLLDNDDDFFHVTCHVDGNLKAKIKSGEFVELERLLPKERGGAATIGNGDTMDFRSFIQAIARGGSTYMGPSLEGNKDRKISSICKWEQAFRVYAVIYTEAHPERAAKIWQYVYTINTAAASFSWENVYFYDQTFRRLMEEKPWRSWSKTYTQGWNIAMRDSINNNSNRIPGNQSNPNFKRKDWKDECCWKFNKNRCTRGSDCNYDHRCTYCGGWKHGFHNCRKRLGKRNTGTSKKESSTTKN